MTRPTFASRLAVTFATVATLAACSSAPDAPAPEKAQDQGADLTIGGIGSISVPTISVCDVPTVKPTCEGAKKGYEVAVAAGTACPLLVVQSLNIAVAPEQWSAQLSGNDEAPVWPSSVQPVCRYLFANEWTYGATVKFEAADLCTALDAANLRHGRISIVIPASLNEGVCPGIVGGCVPCVAPW